MNFRAIESSLHYQCRAFPNYHGLTSRGRPTTRDGHTLSESLQFEGAVIWYKVVGNRALYMVQPL